MEIAPRRTPELQQRQPDRTILIVDDEEIIRDLCAKALSGYRILQAGNGREALAVLTETAVDVVLTDIMMPEMNGLELLQAIKDQSPNRVVVMMTGYGDKEVILRALKLNADDFISKPLNLLQMRTVIAKALERMSLREELVELQKMDALKSEFLGLISHKLKTPVTVISLFIQNLVREQADRDESEFHKNLSLIQEESNYLASLIQDLLQYSGKVLSPRPAVCEAIDLADLAAACLTELQDQAATQQTTIINQLPPELPPVSADREQLAFCLRALLDNAIKFTLPAGSITLTAKTSAGRVEVSIADDGPGIAADQQTKIFEKFYQIDPDHTGQVRGFGLGLFYTRQFLQPFGGRLLLESRPGTGSTFTLSLPTAPPS